MLPTTLAQAGIGPSEEPGLQLPGIPGVACGGAQPHLPAADGMPMTRRTTREGSDDAARDLPARETWTRLGWG